MNHKYNHLLCGIALCTLGVWSTPALANPIGGAVVSGSATIANNGATTTITQHSQRAVIEWQNFSIDAGELTQFLQNNADSAVLNKVISSIPSSILGSLKANGNVFLVNPNGVVIGNGAQINANSFIASTLNISNSSFMDGGDLTFKGNSTAAIINLGEIKAGKGDVYLLARQIKNAGRIEAKNGTAALAAGSEIYLSADDGFGRRITVKANEFAEELRDKIAIENLGAIEAARAILATHNGDIYDMAINNSGTIRAQGISQNADGSLSLWATSSGGRKAGKVVNSGTLSARSLNGGGGKIVVTGDVIKLTSSSIVDASAEPNFIPPTPLSKPENAIATANNRGATDQGGGTILIGGDYQGKNADIQNASMVSVDNGSVLKANAGQQGDGGKIIVWADESTNISGTIEATGGTQSGNGGFVETSGKNTLKVASETTIDISATNGKGGQWLLDPTDITITDGGGGDVDTATINATLNGGGDVTITTASADADNGDITLTNANIDKSTSNNNATLTLRADRNIISSNSNITSTSGDALNVVFNANASDTGGAISLTDTVINTSGGNVTLGGGSNILTGYATGVSGLDDGVTLDNSQITSGAGDIIIRGQGFGDTLSSDQNGVLVTNGSVLQTTTGTITLNGIGGAGEDNNFGAYITGSGTQITSVDGDILITGQAGSNETAGSIENYGIRLNDGAQITSTGTGADAATITLDGTGGEGEDNNSGVYLGGTGVAVTSVDGDILITGQGGVNDALIGSVSNRGVFIERGALVSSTGTGVDAATITINGTGAAGEDNNQGVRLEDVGTLITSIDGDILIAGQGGSNGDSASNSGNGISMTASVAITSTGTGANAANITLDGVGGKGERSNGGVAVGSLTRISSIDGDILITGQAASNASTTSSAGTGVQVNLGALIESTGTGADAATITINGTGDVADDSNYGVSVDDVGTLITSVDGDISITGQGGSDGSSGSNFNYGVFINDSAEITSTGTDGNAADITITGTGGAGDTGNIGVYIRNGSSRVATTAGDILITGQGGSNGSSTSNTNTGVWLRDSTTAISSDGSGAGAGNITLIGTGGAGQDDNFGVEIENTLIVTEDGNVDITARGGSNGDGDDNYGFYANGSVNPTIGIESTGTGAHAGTITINATGGAGEDGNNGVYIQSSGTLITSVDGDISITGQGGSNGASGSNNNYGAFISGGADIISTGIGANAATITIDGTGGAGQDRNSGVFVANTGTVIESHDGDIVITGRAGGNGSGSTGRGVDFERGEVRSVGMTADAATITITGYGAAAGGANYGVFLLRPDMKISSYYGDIILNGYGGSNSSGNGNAGIAMANGASIESLGTGADAAKITLNGTAGAGEDSNQGVNIDDSGTQITSVDGDILITGQGGSNGSAGSNDNYGVRIVDGATIVSTGTGANAATITIDGTGGAGDDSNRGVSIESSGTQITSVDGDISITGQGHAAEGVRLSSATVTTTGDGDIDVTATSSGELASGFFNAADIVDSTVTATASGNINITGDGSNITGAGVARGILFTNGLVETNTGDITATGSQYGGTIGIGTWGLSEPIIRSTGGGDITWNATNGVINFSTGVVGEVHEIGDVGTNNITFISDTISKDTNVDLRVRASGDIILKPNDNASTIGIGSGGGTFNVNSTLLAELTPDVDGNSVGRLIIGDSANATGHVDIDGLDVFANNYDIYGGSITARNLSNVDSSTSTLTARTGDLTLFDDAADDASILDEIKANFQTLVGDLILAPTTSSDTIGIAGEAGTFNFTQAELQGFSQIGRNLIIGDPTAGAGDVRVGALDLTGETYGIGFHGSDINLQGAIQSAGDIKLAGNDIIFNNHDLIADGNVILTTQNTALDIGVSGGTGAFLVTDTVLGDIFADNDGNGSGNLIIGDSQTGSGDINIDGLDLSTAGYGLEFHGGRVNFSNQAVSSDGDMVIGADTLLNFTTAIDADGSIEIAPRTAVAMAIDDTATNTFTLNGDTFSLALLNNNQDGVGSEGLILGSANAGNVTWTSDTHDFTAIDARTGGNLTLVNSNAAYNYGLGDGTTGDTTYTTAQMEAMIIGDQLIIGDAAAGTGTIDIADLSAADLDYGLNASGGTIAIGGWNGNSSSDVNLLARTGDITTTGGLITANNMTLNAAGNVGTSGNALNTDLSGGTLDYVSGGDVYVTNANDLNVASGSQTGAGNVDIRATNGQLSLGSAINFTGDVLLESGGTNSDFLGLHNVNSTATSDSNITIRAGRSITTSTANTLENSNGNAINVTLNADRDANQNGAVDLENMTINTNNGDFIVGGGVNPLTTVAYGTTDNTQGVVLRATNINTGTGDISVRGQGFTDRSNSSDFNSLMGVIIDGDSVIETTSGDIDIVGQGGANNRSDTTWHYGIRIGFSGGTSAVFRTETGAMTFTGQGGGNGTINRGITIEGSGTSVISSTGTGASVGDITLNGTGGKTGTNNDGIVVGGIEITSVDADISITGQGDSSSAFVSSGNSGVSVQSNTNIETTGTGNVTIHGTGGHGDDHNSGVILTSGTEIDTAQGDISITGQGGSNGQTGSVNNHGIFVNSNSKVRSNGVGKITLNGTGGNGEDTNQGVRIENVGVEITSAYGDMLITGQAGSNGQTESDNNVGVFVGSQAVIRSTGSGDNAAKITVNGTGGNGEGDNYGVRVGGSGTQITSIDGDISITGQAGSNGQTGSSNNRGVFVESGAVIRSTGTTSNAAQITINGTGGDGEDNNHGVRIEDAGTEITSVDGDILITGQAGSNGQTGSSGNYGIDIRSDAVIRSTGITSDAATITINGTGGLGDDTNYGVRLDGTGPGVGTEITSVYGDILIAGQGGTSGQTDSNGNYGVYLRNGFRLSSTGLGDDAANITINGTGGLGHSNNIGVNLDDAGTSINTVDGDISIVGQGQSHGGIGSSGAHGVMVQAGASVESSGAGANAGTITINGTAGAGDSINNGVRVQEVGTQVTAVDGDISITGQGNSNGSSGVSSNRGVFILSKAQVTTTGTDADLAGNISITGIADPLNNNTSTPGVLVQSDGTRVATDAGNIVMRGEAASGAVGIDLNNAVEIETQSHDASITFVADRVSFEATPIINADGDVIFNTITDGRVIEAGTGSGAGLSVNNTELSTISADRVIFGNQNGGTNAIELGFLTSGKGYDVHAYGASANVHSGFASDGNIVVNVDSFTYGGSGNLTAAGDITVANQTDNRSIALGSGTGDLMLSDTLINNINATGNVIIGDNTTSVIHGDAIAWGGNTNDMILRAGRVNFDNGATFGGELLVEALSGDVRINGGALTADGQLVVDVQQGNFLTNQGANVFNVTGGGDYTLYTEGPFASQIDALRSNAELIDGQNSSSMTVASLTPGTNRIIFRNNFEDSVSQTTSVGGEVAQLQELPTQPEKIIVENNTISDALDAPQIEIKQSRQNNLNGVDIVSSNDVNIDDNTNANVSLQPSNRGSDNDVNSDSVKGIGIKDSNCSVTDGEGISCRE